jgi:hypothetical protein
LRLSEIPPALCSACSLQRPDLRHVDFDAAWDGPTVEGGLATGDGVVRGPLVSIDELVICEECLRAAGRLIDLEPVEGGRVEALEQQLADAREVNLELQGHVKAQDKALQSRDSFGEAQQARRQAKQRAKAA